MPWRVATFLFRNHPPLTHLVRILRHDDDGAGIQVSFLLSVLRPALNRRFIQLGSHFPVDAFSNLRHNTIAKSSSKQVTWIVTIKFFWTVKQKDYNSQSYLAQSSYCTQLLIHEVYPSDLRKIATQSALILHFAVGKKASSYICNMYRFMSVWMSELAYLFWKLSFSMDNENKIINTKGKATRTVATMLNLSWWNPK